ncbi:hypothetical protein OGAPHI_001089 [Ogataea philodendri]|uniref:Uncharacterized protein n=1 Tax=Ogataea philodendri TaxID=1378263 RepID=A0A9P8PG17_9ASCO|nr:uncharacterized protein OGAPHI_001089 [Ogataea philodendri]KAH3670574.1 hypothetical protein OGAPHI_001089 [Ogataea philodendri]
MPFLLASSKYFGVWLTRSNELSLVKEWNEYVDSILLLRSRPFWTTRIFMVSPKNLCFINSANVSSSSGVPGSLLNPVKQNSDLKNGFMLSTARILFLNLSISSNLAASSRVNVMLSLEISTKTSRLLRGTGRNFWSSTNGDFAGGTMVVADEDNDSLECRVDFVTTGIVTPIGDGFLPTGPSFSNLESIFFCFPTMNDFSCEFLRSLGFFIEPWADAGLIGESVDFGAFGNV